MDTDLPMFHQEHAPCAGLLFIGDPHLDHRRPGSRIDDYLSAVLGKLAAAFDIAEKHNLRAIITGDLFHRPRVGDLGMLQRLIMLLKAQPRRAYCLVGNHDRQESELTHDTSLGLLFATGMLLPLESVCLSTTTTPIQLRGVPHGQPIPASVEEGTILVTHHDFGFPDSQYPGCVPPPEVKGARMAVNGHIHAASRPVTAGSTTWFNPGNISRVSRAERDHVPRVWAWTPGALELTPHELPHAPKSQVFEEIKVIATDAEAAVDSIFATLIAAESGLDASASEDGSLLAVEMAEVLDAAEASLAERAYLQGLLQRATSPVETS